MLSSSGAKTSLVKTSSQGALISGYDVPSLLKTEPYQMKPITNTLCLKVNQPGLPSWWSLAAPQLNWMASFTSQLSWATMVLNPSPLLLGQDSDLSVDWLVPSTRLVTLTSGPMASKKSSSVQLSLFSKPLQLSLCARVTEGLELSPQKLTAALKIMSSEGLFWTSSLPTPMAVSKSKITMNVGGPTFLLWR